jgi:hypothetical protein
MSTQRLARRVIITKENISNRILTIINTRQNGVCCFCEQKILSEDILVSTGIPRSYYHIDCARRLHII